jgi:hypothetical protein
VEQQDGESGEENEESRRSEAIGGGSRRLAAPRRHYTPGDYLKYPVETDTLRSRSRGRDGSAYTRSIEDDLRYPAEGGTNGMGEARRILGLGLLKHLFLDLLK